MSSKGSYDAQNRWKAKNPELVEHYYETVNKDEHNKSQRDLLIKRRTFEIDESLAKPWDDKESLFCDSEFLTRPVNKGGLGLNIRNGKECK